MSTTTRPRGPSLRDQRHDAIVDAARALATGRGAQGFTVEQVAAAAGVSRRTVFNHFTGLDQLLVAVCQQILAEVIAELLERVDRSLADLPDGEEGGRLALDAVHDVTRGADLPSAIVVIHHVLGRPEGEDERAEAISRSAFEHVVGRLRERLLTRAPSLDPFDVELSLALLTSGLALLARHWLERHPDLDRDVPREARADWDRLLDRLLDRLRSGHSGHSG
ncbi:TetR/AcrR family transcriptional regulator [Nocardioides sp. zg-1308]|uniref:TetR family transcriptional regulator n=1 Tax=Nocardioides TaxID=1839 RepID=UPI001556E817|nr:TetR/AcrR family transcriptional regulator [Nocardioides sp. S-34]NPD04633.1 TetR/AcrR family transcriptional regulator [Nocardioides sp. zg-1308]WQQ22525.1 TetR/AcrR family transcriptional regulator [Nocardioides sp. S-34]